MIYFLVLLVAIILSIAIIAILYKGLLKDNACRLKISILIPCATIFLLFWISLISTLSLKGSFRFSAAGNVPLFIVLMLVFVGSGLSILFNAKFRSILYNITQSWLILFQTHRIIIGTLFLLTIAQQKLPQEFALSAGIGDLTIGLTSFLVYYLYHKKYHFSNALLLIWNILGIAEIVATIIKGIVMSPTPFQRVFNLFPTLEFIGTFPFVLVPLFLALSAIIVHSWSITKIVSHKKHTVISSI